MRLEASCLGECSRTGPSRPRRSRPGPRVYRGLVGGHWPENTIQQWVHHCAMDFLLQTGAMLTSWGRVCGPSLHAWECFQCRAGRLARAHVPQGNSLQASRGGAAPGDRGSPAIGGAARVPRLYSGSGAATSAGSFSATGHFRGSLFVNGLAWTCRAVDRDLITK